jgi:heptosyltransferase-2
VTAPERILVFQPAYLGDVVFASPLTAALALAWPKAEIAFVARPPADALAAFLPGVSRVLTYDKRGVDRGLGGIRRLTERIRRFAPDVWFSLHGSLRSGLVALLGGARTRIGPSGTPGSFGFNHRVRYDRGLTFTGKALALVRAAGIAGSDRLALVLPEKIREQGRGALQNPTVAIIPGSVWPTKRWPAASAGRLAAQLRGLGYEVVALGSTSERELCQVVVDAGGPGCRNLAGSTIEESLAVLSACRAAVGGDSGLTHAARALEVPVATIFGPTSPAHHSMGARDVFVSLGLPCSPCSDHGQKRCPLGHHDCMRKLSPKLVTDAVLPVLEASGARP